MPVYCIRQYISIGADREIFQKAQVLPGTTLLLQRMCVYMLSLIKKHNERTHFPVTARSTLIWIFEAFY